MGQRRGGSADVISPVLRASVLNASKTLEWLNQRRYSAHRLTRPDLEFAKTAAKSRRELRALSSHLREHARLHFQKGMDLVMALHSLRRTITDILESEEVCGGTRDQLLAESTCACVIEYYASAHGPGLPTSSGAPFPQRSRARGSE